MGMKEETRMEKARAAIAIRDIHMKQILAEFASTFFLVFLGTCNVAQFHLTHMKVNSWIQVHLGWGLIIMFCVFMSGRISGAHMNPAISFLFFSFGDLPLNKFFTYMAAQFVGSFLGAAAAYFFYLPLFDAFDGGNRSVTGEFGSASVFCSYPAPHLGVVGPYVDQIVGTALLAFFVCLIVDERNDIPSFLHPLFIGFAIMTIGMTFAVNLGYPVNPARDFGPRLFTFLVYGGEVFTHPYSMFWVAPLIAPMVGGPLGGWLYQVLFGFHLPERSGDVYRIVENHELKNLA